jgi:sulfocyanin SoxE-like protein
MFFIPESDGPRMRRLSSWLGRLTLVVLPVLFLAGCAETDTVSRAPHPVVRISERDFRIVVEPARVPAGDVELVVGNQGPDTHELIMVRSSRLQPPLRRDGLTVDEKALHEVGAVEGLDSHRVRRVRLHLAPGRYELFCNMAGHFLAGMHAELVVD